MSAGPMSADLGPRPAHPTDRPPALSAARRTVLGALDGQPEPVSLAALAAVTGLHANTLREHLGALTEAGLVRRERAAASGRGRPAWLYSAVSGKELPTGVSEYAGLASALAEAIERTSDSPRDGVVAAVAAGRTWGRQLATDTPLDPARPGHAGARRQVVRLLDQLGFAPRPDARDAIVKLTRCPLLEAAHRHPEIVCGVHLGIIRGALDVYGGDTDRVELLAFHEPGACRLDLMAPRAEGSENRP
ncbi:helix-turn-helix transcriptional regulator [Pseudonocardia hispaniensis]|uniref:Helix-turn-helix transcriptional regulator n=1 Tax=Pseudonocardia hispaniensis TaxID=904933 RepID=A0ABW1J7E3_9PSEU